MTSTNNNEIDEVCASCGIAAVDNIKLKKCNGCKLVRYCSIACQKKHWSQHKCVCKKRAAELREELLFKQPESSHLGDCSLCFLPLPDDNSKFIYESCCSKLICLGCIYANAIRHKEESLGPPKCPFCRTPTPKTRAEAEKLLRKRIEASDPWAICEMGAKQSIEGNYSSVFELWTKAAELGHVEAHRNLARLYMNMFGQGVDRDEKRGIIHLEEAAIGGHPIARYMLGVVEYNRGKIERARKHWIIAASLGNNESIGQLKKGYTKGFVNKEDLAAAFRAHKAAVDATKSPQREAADRFFTKTKSKSADGSSLIVDGRLIEGEVDATRSPQRETAGRHFSKTKSATGRK